MDGILSFLSNLISGAAEQEVEQPKSGHAQPDSPWSSEASAEAKDVLRSTSSSSTDVLPSSSSTESTVTDQQQEDMFADLLARGQHLDDSFEDISPEGSEECSLEQLTEWAQKEKLGSRFLSHLEELIKQGGLRKVTDKVLRDLGIMLPALRKKILVAIKRKLVGNQKVRFGEILKFDPILTKIPNRGCPWLNIDAIEVRHDRDTWQAAIRTWRFCSTGMDGLEEISLLRDVFDAWKATPKGILQMLQDMLEDVGGEDFGVKCFQETQWPMLMRGSVQSWRDLCAVVEWPLTILEKENQPEEVGAERLLLSDLVPVLFCVLSNQFDSEGKQFAALQLQNLATVWRQHALNDLMEKEVKVRESKEMRPQVEAFLESLLRLRPKCMNR
eukprot:s765_g11.t1